MKKIIALLVLVVLVVGGWTAAWFYVAGEVRRNIGLLADGDGVDTPQITCANLDVGGFPFRFDVTCSGAVLQQGDITLDAAELRASVLVYAPTHAQIFAQSPLLVADAFSGARSELRWASLHGSARLGGWSIERISVVGDSLEWLETITNEQKLATATHIEAHLLDKPAGRNKEAGTQTLDAFLRIDNLSAPLAQIASGNLTSTAELSGVPDDIRTYGAGPSLVQRIAAAGGDLKLIAFDAKDGDISFGATGEVKLDAQLRPEGQFVLKAVNVYERVGTLIPEPMKSLIFGQRGADGSYTQTLDLRQGVIFAGLVPLGVVPPLM